MNIFVLATEAEECAAYHCDKHVVKMILEYAQLLSCAHRVLESPIADQVYAQTHVNHPCSIWVRESAGNYQWLFTLFNALCREYTYRYGKVHKTEKKLGQLLASPPPCLADLGLTPFPQAMPDEYKRRDVVNAYRDYYMGEKSELLNWKNRDVPFWVDSVPQT